MCVCVCESEGQRDNEEVSLFTLYDTNIWSHSHHISFALFVYSFIHMI